MSGRWSTGDEIKEVLELDGCGPVLYREGKDNYAYSGESNQLVCGCTGTGKSRRVLFGTVRNIISNGEIAIIQDPKGEIYDNTAYYAKKQGVDIKVINFRSPDKSLRWHPLSLLWELHHRGEKNDAQEMVEEIVNNLVDAKNREVDTFWVDKHESLLKGVFNLGLEYCTKKEYTFANMLDLIYQDERSLTQKGDEIVSGGLFNEILDILPEVSKAKKLRDYACLEARRTRNSVMAESTGTLTKFTTTQSIINMTSDDDFGIIDITADKPFLLYIITPDDSDIYDMFSTLLVFQLFRHMVKHADAACGGRLKIRVNVLLDELGNVGRTLTTLPHLLSAGRSRGIRTMIVLQTLSQLDTIYGQSRAKTILGNADVLICFRTEDGDTLERLSYKAGKKTIKAGDYSYTKSLISGSELSSMETGQAIIFIRGRTRFISELPDYLEMFDCSDISAVPFPETSKNATPKSVSLSDIKDRILSGKKINPLGSYYRDKLFELKKDEVGEAKPHNMNDNIENNEESFNEFEEIFESEEDPFESIGKIFDNRRSVDNE